MNVKIWYKKRVIKFKQFKHQLKVIRSNVLVWSYYKKKMIILFWADAPKEQRWLEKGNYYLRKGAQVQVGQPLQVPIPKRDKSKTATKRMYIKNLYFNFSTNKVTATYSAKPIKGKSEPFL